MKTGLFTALLLGVVLAGSSLAAGESWTGSYTDKKFLNGQAVFQLNVVQEAETISVDFNGVYNDGHGCAPHGNGPAKVVDQNTLKFTFTDSAGDSGTGTIKRDASGVLLSIKPGRIADRHCTVFYRENIRLHPAQ
ncbi:MAG TPA: hypothetical protein VH207_11170 [Chthoniobacterales bacterium]|jgi:hypothetical protein|nr:hypothetical protein [Chthoniobacterales bacterium]